MNIINVLTAVVMVLYALCWVLVILLNKAAKDRRDAYQQALNSEIRLRDASTRHIESLNELRQYYELHKVAESKLTHEAIDN